MVKHTQAIRRLLPTNCLKVFDHFVRLALNELMKRLFENGQRLNTFTHYFKGLKILVTLCLLFSSAFWMYAPHTQKVLFQVFNFLKKPFMRWGSSPDFASNIKRI